MRTLHVRSKYRPQSPRFHPAIIGQDFILALGPSRRQPSLFPLAIVRAYVLPCPDTRRCRFIWSTLFAPVRLSVGTITKRESVRVRDLRKEKRRVFLREKAVHMIIHLLHCSIAVAFDR